MARLSVMATPVIHASDLRALVAYYRHTLGFELMQEVPAVVALLGIGPVRLQLWQREGLKARSCHISLENGSGFIFRLYARLARQAPNALVEGAPTLRPWGAWEFILRDGQGNRLVFSERAALAASDPRVAREHGPRHGR